MPQPIILPREPSVFDKLLPFIQQMAFMKYQQNMQVTETERREKTKLTELKRQEVLASTREKKAHTFEMWTKGFSLAKEGDKDTQAGPYGREWTKPEQGIEIGKVIKIAGVDYTTVYMTGVDGKRTMQLKKAAVPQLKYDVKITEQGVAVTDKTTGVTKINEGASKAIKPTFKWMPVKGQKGKEQLMRFNKETQHFDLPAGDTVRRKFKDTKPFSPTTIDLRRIAKGNANLAVTYDITKEQAQKILDDIQNEMKDRNQNLLQMIFGSQSSLNVTNIDDMLNKPKASDFIK